MNKKVLVPIDGSEGGWKAMAAAKELAEKFGGELVVLHVVMPYAGASVLAVPLDHSMIAAGNKELEAIGTQVLEMAKERLGGFDKVTYVKEMGRPSKVIVSVTKELGADCVVIGNRGLSGLAEFFLGSVSSEVAQLSPVPVYIVK